MGVKNVDQSAWHKYCSAIFSFIKKVADLIEPTCKLVSPSIIHSAWVAITMFPSRADISYMCYTAAFFSSHALAGPKHGYARIVTAWNAAATLTMHQ